MTNDADIELDELMRGFDPTSDRVDAILLHLLTGEGGNDSFLKDWLGESREVMSVGGEKEDEEDSDQFWKASEDSNPTI